MLFQIYMYQDAISTNALTALIKVLNDIRLNTDSGKLTVLVLLDLSAAFDTIDHKIVLDRLVKWVGLSGTVLTWFRTYLEGRDCFVSVDTYQSEKTTVPHGVQQGSIICSLLAISSKRMAYHSFADDMQIYLTLSPSSD